MSDQLVSVITLPWVTDLLIDDTDGVRRITLDRADAANSITPDQRDALIDALG